MQGEAERGCVAGRLHAQIELIFDADRSTRRSPGLRRTALYYGPLPL